MTAKLTSLTPQTWYLTAPTIGATRTFAIAAGVAPPLQFTVYRQDRRASFTLVWWRARRKHP
jgi:hypothetical protein